MDPFQALGDLRKRIPKLLSVRHLVKRDGELSMTHDRLRGRISSGGVVVDGINSSQTCSAHRTANAVIRPPEQNQIRENGSPRQGRLLPAPHRSKLAACREIVGPGSCGGESESARSKIRLMARRILKKHGTYRIREKVARMVSEQAELLCADWAG